MEKLSQDPTSETQAKTGWEDLAEVVSIKPEAASPETTVAAQAIPETLPASRERVLNTYRHNSAKDGHEQLETIGQIMTELDNYWMSNTVESRISNALWLADLAGVVIDVKPTALIQIPSTETNIGRDKIAQMLENMGIAIADGWENGKFFVSKQSEKAEELKAKFEKMWSHDWSKREDQDLGRLLGYPETAIINTHENSQPKGSIQKLKQHFAPKADLTFDRHYTHSAEHYQEEFESYEHPIHAFLEQYCPKATEELKKEKTTKGKLYKWL